MKIALRCEKCGTLFMQDEDELCLEIDFKDKVMRFYCRQKNCKHENVMNFADWKKTQERSSLPRIGVM